MIRICTKCGQEKQLEEFVKAKRYKNGYRRQCKVCINEQSKAYYYKTIEERKQWFRQYYIDNKDKILENRKKYLEDPQIQEKFREYARLYYYDNKEVMKDNHQRWMDKNKDKWNEYQREYAKRKRLEKKQQQSS